MFPPGSPNLSYQPQLRRFQPQLPNEVARLARRPGRRGTSGSSIAACLPLHRRTPEADPAWRFAFRRIPRRSDLPVSGEKPIVRLRMEADVKPEPEARRAGGHPRGARSGGRRRRWVRERVASGLPPRGRCSPARIREPRAVTRPSRPALQQHDVLSLRGSSGSLGRRAVLPDLPDLRQGRGGTGPDAALRLPARLGRVRRVVHLARPLCSASRVGGTRSV